jgi:hypothetical protein
MEVPMVTQKTGQQKKTFPEPGRKATLQEALARTNQKYHKALSKLAK